MPFTNVTPHDRDWETNELVDDIKLELPEYTDLEIKPVRLYVKSYPDNKKIAAIKTVRELTGLGLKDAKMFVEGGYREYHPYEAKVLQTKLGLANIEVILRE